MDYIFAIGIAFFFSFTGMLPPGMLNMTTVGLSMKKGFYPALWFAVGAALVEFIQALMVVKFSAKLAQFLEGNIYVNYVAVVVLLALALSFFFAKPKKDNSKVDENLDDTKNGGTLIKGMTLALANVLVYAFWLGVGIYWTQKGILDGSWSMSIIFSIGIFIGSIAAYLIYIVLGEKILKKFDVVANNLNKILAALFFLLAAGQVYQIVSTDHASDFTVIQENKKDVSVEFTVDNPEDGFEYLWDFADSTSAKGSKVEHLYKSEKAVYTVVLKVVKAEGDTVSTTRTVFIEE